MLKYLNINISFSTYHNETVCDSFWDIRQGPADYEQIQVVITHNFAKTSVTEQYDFNVCCHNR